MKMKIDVHVMSMKIDTIHDMKMKKADEEDTEVNTKITITTAEDTNSSRGKLCPFFFSLYFIYR
jgi:hypothetical protein